LGGPSDRPAQLHSVLLRQTRFLEKPILDVKPLDRLPKRPSGHLLPVDLGMRLDLLAEAFPSRRRFASLQVYVQTTGPIIPRSDALRNSTLAGSPSSP